MSQLSVTPTLWNSVLDELRRLFSTEIFSLWFAPLAAREEGDGTLVLVAASDFAAIWLEDNWLEVIQQKAELVANRPVGVRIEVEASTPVPEPVAPSRLAGSGYGARPAVRTVASPARKRGLVLNERNTFENFIVGPSNSFAHAAAMAVAQGPGRSYNPLFLYGETGLGKTHLMHAIAHQILRADPSANVAYVSCEKFTNEFIRAIQEQTVVKFRKFYRDVDVLLIDDVHFLAGKESTQEEFFHTFNELFESSRQICLTSDRPANEIAKLEARLVSRFQWGLVTDMQAPDLETRTAILAKKAATQGYHLAPEILEFLASRITRNVRRMEGALTRVGSYASLTRQPLDLATAERLLQDILREEATNQTTVEQIQRKVVEYYDLRMSDMSSRRRPNNIAFPRQVAMYLCRLLTHHSLQEIGDSFGGRDHGTVIHACRQVENMMEQDESVRRSVEYLTNQLAQRQR